MHIFSTISDFLINGFVITLLLLLIGYFTLREHDQTIKKLMTLTTFPLLTGSAIFLTLMIFQVINLGNTGDDFERYAIVNRMFGPFWYLFWSIVVLKGILPQILWLKRLRNNIQFLILLLPFLLIEFYLPFIMNLITSLNRTHLPSSWRVAPDIISFVWPILIYTIYLIAAYTLTRSKKTY